MHPAHATRRLPNGRFLAATLALLTACADAPTLPHLRPSASARDAGTDSGTVSIAPAPRARWTVMVYLAADNNLAPAALADLAEMEAGVAALASSRADSSGTASADVQVVVQGELSRAYMARAGCAEPACAGLASWSTFRYAVSQRTADAMIDLGDRDLTRPEELRAFVAWAKAVRPADHYMLVLWSPGGGYTGVVADESSAGSRRMTLGELREALADTDPIDVIDFDMSLGASYETLAKVAGVARTAVFSQGTTPGTGTDYAALVRWLGEAVAAGDTSADSVAALAADRFHVAHLGDRETTTISAYGLAGFAGLESSLDALASELTARLTDSTRAAATAAAIREAVAASQRFDRTPLHDLVDALDSLGARTAPPNESIAGRTTAGDTTLARLIADVRERATAPSFRLRAYARTGTAPRALDVARATGLGIVWPSGGEADALPDAGPSSMRAYAELMPGRPWTRFLAAYLAAAPTSAAIDQGERPLQLFVQWDAHTDGIDLDLWVLEPDGTLYIPYLGRVTPNGDLTADSWAASTAFEGYATRRFVARGTYLVFANLVQDSFEASPTYDLVYRRGAGSDFATLFDSLPRLSLERSYALDSTATLEKAAAGAYTDLRLVATWTPAPADSTSGAPAPDDLVAAPLAEPAASAQRSARVTARLHVSAAQLATVRRARQPGWLWGARDASHIRRPAISPPLSLRPWEPATRASTPISPNRPPSRSRS